MQSLKIISWNVRGFRTQEKRIKIMNHLTKLRADICFLQETHVTEKELSNIKLIQFEQIFSSTYNSRQRGVSILINKNIPFVHNSTVTDPDGRFIIINISINQNVFTLVNIYGPNNEDPSFFHNLFSSITDSTNIILAGDFNTIINPKLDRSNSQTYRNCQTTETIKEYMKHYGLGDSWRIRNPLAREYTYYSSVHQSSSRIDFFLISNSLAQYVTETSIHPILISDHAPISLTLTFQMQIKPNRRWCFNTSLLQDADFDDFIKREWSFFLEMNDLPNTSPSLLWETGKAYIRGKIIAYSTNRKKQQQRIEMDLEQKIKQLSEYYATNPDEETKYKLNNLKLQYENIIYNKTQFLIQQLKYESFEYSNKIGKALANQLQRKKEKSIISSITNPLGQVTQNPQEINNIFKNFYTDLYRQEQHPKQSEIDDFLQKLELPKLSKEQANMLDNPLTLEELHKALEGMSNNKSPGQDGFPAEFYKHFWQLLSPLYHKVVAEIHATSTIPPQMNTAVMTVILKPDKDPTLPSSYRPLSLINTDLKIITKALATRIETVTPALIHPDQTGFIKNRNISDSTRRLFNLIHIAQKRQTKSIIVSLDAEKAFDKVNWTFLFSTLHKFGFGSSFIHWIKTLYTSPLATVITNGISSQSFALQRGTRQGCSLSPSLFAIFIEPLAAAIRQNPEIKGIRDITSQHKISLYADDVLLYLEDPYKSTQETFNTISNFSKISNYTINWQKSTILPLVGNAWDSAAQNNSLPISIGNIKYLGVNISSKLSELFNLNYIPLLNKTTQDLKRWNNLPLSLMGRIATVKMKILPRMNYLFSVLPVTPTDNWFSSVNSLVTKFYWKNQKPRISLLTLQKQRSKGGLEAPNFQYYFLSNQLQYLIKWIQKENQSSWKDLEQSQCKDISIFDLPFLPASIKKIPLFDNLTISSTLKAWWKTIKITKSSLTPCKLTPIWHNPDFQLCKKPIYFPSWQQKGITHLHHVFTNDHFISFDLLAQKFGIEEHQFLQYQQLKSVIKSKIQISRNLLESSPFIKEIKKIINVKKLVSRIYKLISCSDIELSLPITKWNNDLTIPTNPTFWTEICNNIFSMTKNTNLQLIQYKIIYRAHITQRKMFKMGLVNTDVCTQCTLGNTDDYLHATWSCPPVYGFWSTVTEKLSTILSYKIPLSPSLCLLGNLQVLDNLPTKYRNPVLISLTIAKKVILLNWKSKSCLHINQWANLIIEYISLEKITFTNKSKLAIFTDTWSLFIAYFKIK